jgi:hypothetical protein
VILIIYEDSPPSGTTVLSNFVKTFKIIIQ